MSGTKKNPERMCVVCRLMKPKKELIRIVNTENGVVVDGTGKLNGRGVYICRCKECVSKAVRGKGFFKQYGFSLETVADELEKAVER